MRTIETDPWAEDEAAEDARRDADLEMAEMSATGAAIDAALAAGRCPHFSTVGYLSPPVYDDQKGLRRGQSRCRNCKRVFANDDELAAASDEAIYG